LYDRLFTIENPGGDNWKEFINPESVVTLKNCRVEPSLASSKPQDRVQFERMGYFCVDKESRPGSLIFNRSVTLRDTWAKIEKKS
jgi:glutaminyl-tRNA synthetase